MKTGRILPQTLGFFGLSGALIFLFALIFLHFVQTDIDWSEDYVSDFANGPYGSLFTIAVLVHSAGNLALAAGLFKCLGSHSLREWASLLFGAAAAVLFGAAAFGIFAAGIFPADVPNISLSFVGLVHRLSVTAAFPLELAALFLFSSAFAKSSGWQMQATYSCVLSILAALGLSVFFVTILVGWMPGLGERIALAGFFPWELWTASRLTRMSHAANVLALQRVEQQLNI